jgi:hypothetical protein
MPRISPRYWLPKHIYVAVTHDGAVFLDTKKDKYIGLAATHCNALSALVQDWPASARPDPSNNAADETEAESVASHLVEAGLLSRIHPGRLREAPRDALTDSATLLSLGANRDTRIPIQGIDILRFILAWVRASSELRLLPIHRVIEAVESRKCRHYTAASAFDVEEAGELTRKFRRLRAFVFSGRNHCLFHSLVLVHFLASYNVFPTWVVGIRTRPFGAHSWVQYKHYVLDTTPEHVCFYTPIMTI